MKKITLLLFAMFAFAWQANAQTLNQNAAWPNGAWTVTGTYNTDPLAFEANPVSDANFAFDDDDAGSGSDDIIAAESPIIDLTAASNAGEIWITISANFVYNHNTDDILQFEYYDADAATWNIIGTPINYDTAGGLQNDFCSGVSEAYTTDILDVTSFTATQLSGFRYRIYYDDTLGGAGYEWGFCFQSPTITSSSPPTCTTAVVNSATVMPDCSNAQFSVDVDVATVGDGANVTDGLGGTFPVVSGIVTAGPYATGVTVTLTLEHTDAACDFSLGDFSYDDCPTQVLCGTPTNTTYCYSSNDNTMFAYQSSDGSLLKVTFNAGNTESCCDDLVIIDSDGVTELYRGVGDAGDLTGVTVNATGDTIYVGVDSDGSIQSCSTGADWDWDVECLACAPATTDGGVVTYDCINSQYSIAVNVTDVADGASITDGTTPQTITGNATYTFGPYAFGVDTTLDFVHSDTACDFTIGSYAALACPPDNDECGAATALTVNADYACGVVTSGTVAGATNSGVNVCSGTEDDDVWYSFVATSTGHRVSLINVAGSNTDMYHAVYDATPGCGALSTSVICNDGNTSNLTGLTIGNTYLVQVYTWTATAGQTTTFDICVGSPPTCPVPTGGSATAITDTSADLGWTEAGTATTWNVEWGVAPLTLGGGTTITGTTTNPESLTGLTAETDYQYYVQADCGGGDTSAWSGPYSFTTEVAPPACGGNFYDTGASTGNYGSSESYTITICPDISGDAVSAAFTSFLVEGDGVDACYDALLIYDGADNTATPITPASLGLGAGTEGFCWQGVGDGTADLTGQTITSSDASGCLTFTFTSDGSVQFSGWEAMIGCSPLSAQDIAFNYLFSYFPNPVNNNLTLTAQKDINNIAVYNMLGQEVLRTAPNTMNTEVNMSNLQTGAYFVKVTIGNTTETVRVIKN